MKLQYKILFISLFILSLIIAGVIAVPNTASVNPGNIATNNRPQIHFNINAKDVVLTNAQNQVTGNVDVRLFEQGLGILILQPKVDSLTTKYQSMNRESRNIRSSLYELSNLNNKLTDIRTFENTAELWGYAFHAARASNPSESLLYVKAFANFPIKNCDIKNDPNFDGYVSRREATLNARVIKDNGRYYLNSQVEPLTEEVGRNTITTYRRDWSVDSDVAVNGISGFTKPRGVASRIGLGGSFQEVGAAFLYDVTGRQVRRLSPGEFQIVLRCQPSGKSKWVEQKIPLSWTNNPITY